MLHLKPFTCNCGKKIERYYDTQDNGSFTNGDTLSFYWYCSDCGANIEEHYKLAELKMTFDEI